MKKTEIAIVGIGCHTPGGVHGPDQFWNQLTRGINGVTEVPKDRWDVEEYYDPNPNKAGKIKNNKGGFVEGIDLFDNEFFKVFPKEAERIDPQQRLLLQTTFESMEDAGDKLDALKNTNTAVFMSTFTNDYWDMQVGQENRYGISPHTPMGSSLTAIANRVSYFYNLKGPSVSIDTACSGSLVAVHLACHSIWDGSADAAFAGGVNIIINPESTLMMSKGNFLSPDGYCKSFDERANGYVRSEGVGVVYLKALDKALGDGNKIYGIIRSTVCNSDGFTSEGFTVPSETSQTKMLGDAYKQAGIDTDRLQYIEAHGTGTPVGDPIETRSFSNVFATESRNNPLMIGSVKSNIGHMEGAAGVGGLIKLALSIKNKAIPGNLHFQKINPKIDLENWKLKVVGENTEWPDQVDGSPRVGGVNSFGAGGTNAHLVLEEFVAPEVEVKSSEKENQYLFHTSAMTKEALNSLLTSYKEYILISGNDLRDICYNVGKHRSDLKYRIAIAGKDAEDIIAKIDAYLEGTVLAGVVEDEVDVKPNKLAFVFTGQGPQWYAMGQELIATEPLFKQVIQNIEGYFKEIAGWSLLEEMNKDEENSRVNDTRIAQPAIMAIQIALVELWKKHGVVPQGVVGHSIGEVAAAYTSGALTLEQAVQVIYHRSRGQHAATGKGKMLAISVTQEKAEELIKDVSDVVSIGAVNGPEMIVLSGDERPLIRISELMEANDIFNKFLRVTVPFHSHHMEPLKDELIGSLLELQPQKAKLDLYSTVTGKKEDGSHLLSEYWYQNVRQPVYFSNALDEMLNDGYDLFIEIGPHPALSGGAQELFQKKGINANIFPSIKRKEDEKLRFLQTLGSLYAKGFDLNWDAIYPDSNELKDLPKYTWDLKSFWYEVSEHKARRVEKKPHPLISGFSQSGVNDTTYTFDVLLDRHVDPYIDDHRVDDVIIFPGTGHLEIATAAAKSAFKDQFGFLEDVNFENALFLPEEGEMYDVKIEVYSDEEKYWILSRDKSNPDAEWVKHSNGKMNVLADQFESQAVDLKAIQERVNDRLPVQPMYLELKKSGLFYGPTFKAIKNLWVVDQEILGKIELHESLEYGIQDYYLHPAILDACLHTIFAAKMSDDDEERGIYLPVHIDRYKLHSKPTSKTVYSYIQVAEASSEYLKGDFWIIDEDGTLIAEIQGLDCKYIEGSRSNEQDLGYSGCYEYEWEKAEPFPYKPANNKVLLFGEKGFEWASFQKALEAKGTTIINSGITDYEDRELVLSVFKEIKEAHPTLNRVIITLPLSVHGDSMDESTVNLSYKVLNIFNAIIEDEQQLSVWLINEKADKVVDSDTEINLVDSVSYGLGRVMVNEYPLASVKIADLGNSEDADELKALTTLISSTSNGGDETDFAFRGDEVFVKRLKTVNKNTAQEKASITLPASGSYYQTMLKEKGILDSIAFQQIAPFGLGDIEVEIDVKAAGLNFKDVLNLNGLLTEESVIGGLVGAQLGLECSGVVSKVGKSVTHVQPGDRVIAFSPNSFAGKVVTPKHCVVKLPDHISFEEGATITLVYLTAYHCMFNLGQMDEGERLLIHSATGGVGMAAVALAQLRGIEIFATAGTEKKRELLRKMGVKNVYNSRTIEFHDEIMRDTNGEGVDLVLNSLSGKAIIQSIKCLRPFGRFVEIGKTDIYNDMSLQLKRFGDNLSYFAVDIDRLMAQRPKKAAILFKDVIELFESNDVEPHPFTSFKINEIRDAIDFIAKGKHIGKVVLSMEDQEVTALPAAKLRFSDEKSYIITGGASGFGLELAKWMADNGAKHLALVSRSGPKSEYDFGWIEQMQSLGVNVMIEKLDLSSIEEVKEMVIRVSESAPVGGVMHGAAVLQDSTIQRLDKDLFEKVFVPKAMGAWNLHLATEDLDLDFFLSLSSISAVFGLPGQSNYSSANNFLDKLVQYRKAKGLHAQSVNLGVLGQYAGMSKEGGNVLNVLENQGWLPLTMKQVTSKIERILLEGDVVRMAANIDWLRFRDFFHHLRSDAKFKELLSDENLKVGTSKGSGESLKDQLIAANGEGQNLLAVSLKEALARILGTTPDKLDENKSISAIGLDSLMMNQLRNWILQKLEFNYPLMKLSKGPSIMEVSAHIMESLQGATTGSVETHQDDSGITTEEDIEVVNKWFVHRKSDENESAKLKLFMFHSMGAAASMFDHFMYNSPEGTDVYAVQLPGRENRIGESFYNELEDLLDDLETAMMPLLDGEFAFFGHSFGGIIAFELSRRLRRKHGKEPVHLFSSATMAPQMTVTWKERDVMKQTVISSNSEQKLIGLMVYIDDMDYVKKILPIMRKDMGLLMNYDYQDEPKFDFPITVFSAIEDEVTLPEEMEPWKEHTNAAFKQELVHGDHWFVSRNKEFIRDQINKHLKHFFVALER
ncbi:MAG: short-chain dehydrogenase [Flammeovirgaceae bacterium]|nr:short-chain dehydrogenase [Flammeovirgaceae bacterium]HCX22475.1 short-chain dehydrogenase [Cytophagales bacterium]|tara:strand:+ start:2675 stop:9844 length:7170 start_codon:yes stop_codon:yes gene_type:complete